MDYGTCTAPLGSDRFEQALEWEDRQRNGATLKQPFTRPSDAKRSYFLARLIHRRYTALYHIDDANEIFERVTDPNQPYDLILIDNKKMTKEKFDCDISQRYRFKYTSQELYEELNYEELNYEHGRFQGDYTHRDGMTF